MKEVPKPIGLNAAKAVIEELCTNSVPYEHRRIPPMFMELGSGNGQTTFARYAAYMLLKHKVRQIVGLTTFLEYTVDARKDHMQIMFGDIASAAKGVNHFEGVILLDISALCECVREDQTNYFLERIRDVAKHAVVMFCISPAKVRNLNKRNELKEKLETTFSDLRTVEVEPYSNTELARMVLVKLDDYGIDVEDDVAEKLEQIITVTTLTCARETETMAETLASYAHVNRFSAVLDSYSLEKAFPIIYSKGVTL